MAGRDAERQGVYDAEDAAFVDTSYAEQLGQHGCQWLIERLVATAWWGMAAGASPVLRAARIDSARSTALLTAGGAQLRIAAGMDQAHVLSHELAHLVASPGAGHGPLFRAAHVDVATVLLGSHGSHQLAERYSRASLSLAARRWPAPPGHGEGGLLAVWEARQAIEALRR